MNGSRDRIGAGRRVFCWISESICISCVLACSGVRGGAVCELTTGALEGCPESSSMGEGCVKHTIVMNGVGSVVFMSGGKIGCGNDLLGFR